jgi:hypothetical protein
MATTHHSSKSEEHHQKSSSPSHEASEDTAKPSAKQYDPDAPHPGETLPERSSGVTPEEKAKQEQKESLA